MRQRTATGTTLAARSGAIHGHTQNNTAQRFDIRTPLAVASV